LFAKTSKYVNVFLKTKIVVIFIESYIELVENPNQGHSFEILSHPVYSYTSNRQNNQ